MLLALQQNMLLASVVTGDPPYQFYFESVFDAAPSTVYVSSIAVIGGLDAPAQSVVVNGEQRVNGGAFTTSAVTVDNDDELELRQTSAATEGTSKTTTATIEGVVGRFTTVTAAVTPSRTAWGRRIFARPRRKVT